MLITRVERTTRVDEAVTAREAIQQRNRKDLDGNTEQYVTQKYLYEAECAEEKSDSP